MAIELLAIFEEGTRREEAGEDIRLEADMSAIKRWNDEMAMKELSRAMKGTGL